MSLLDGLFGDGGSSDNKAALDAIKNVPLPVLKQMNPELYQQVVSLNPDLESQTMLGPSAMDGISLDPAYKQAQMSALQKLQNITDGNGQDAVSLSQNARLQSDVNSNLQGNTGAIQQQMAARGLSGGMSEMVGKQIAAQQAANRQSQMGLDINAQAQNRALQALSSQGSLGNQMSQTDFGQQQARAGAGDAISRFNAQNSQQVNQNNVNARNDAQRFNATNQQRMADQNVETKNNAQSYNIGLDQKNFDNQMSKAGGVSNAYSEMARAKDKRRGDDIGMVSGGISAGAKAYAGGA